MKENIEDEILKIAKECAEQKIKDEQEKIGNRLQLEMEDVKFILDLIKKKMLYKKIGDSWDPKGYQLITKDIFLEDYLKKSPRNNWDKKLQVSHRNYEDDFYDLKVEVNGEKYYHIGMIIGDFERELKNKQERISNINQKLIGIERNFKEFAKQEPIIKQMVEDYNQTLDTINNEGDIC